MVVVFNQLVGMKCRAEVFESPSVGSPIHFLKRGRALGVCAIKEQYFEGGSRLG